jgi:hypothetical protein
VRIKASLRLECFLSSLDRSKPPRGPSAAARERVSAPLATNTKRFLLHRHKTSRSEHTAWSARHMGQQPP